MDNVLFQYAFIFFVSMVPFIEVFLTIPTAIIAFNTPPFIVLIIAILGNATSVFLFAFFGVRINKLFSILYSKFRKKEKTPKTINPRIKQTFDRYGATGVCFFSSLLFSSQIGAGTMATFGAPRRQVLIWTNLGVSTLAIIMVTLSITAEELVSSFVSL